MSKTSGTPVPYQVIYSEQVRTELKALSSKAVSCGLGHLVLDALKKIDARLAIYPQFGEPLCDLKTVGETLWIGAIWPLVVRYVIDDNLRKVLIVAPFKPFARLGL